MSKRSVVRVLLSLGLLAGAVRAQEEQTGRVDVCAFATTGGPLAGVDVSVAPASGGARARTGADGLAWLVLSPGAHSITLTLGDATLATVTLPVVWGEVTEVIVHLDASGAAAVDIEAPAWPEAQAAPPGAVPDAALTGALAGTETCRVAVAYRM